MTQTKLVRTGHLRGYATQLETNSAAACDIRCYVGDVCGNTKGWTGLLGLLVGDYMATVDGQLEVCTQLAEGLDSTAHALITSAQNYETSEVNSVCALGRISAQVDPSSESISLVSYPDRVDPVQQLTTPGEYGQILTQRVDEIGGLVGLIDDVWQWVMHESLLERILIPISGDWSKLYSLGDGWENVSSAIEDLRTNLVFGAGRIDPHWEGTDARAFNGHLDQWFAALQADRDAAQELANMVRDLGNNVAESIEVIMAALQTVASIISAALASFAIPAYGQSKLIKAVWDTAKLIWNIYKVINMIRQTVSWLVQMTQGIREIFDTVGRVPQLNTA